MHDITEDAEQPNCIAKLVTVYGDFTHEEEKEKPYIIFMCIWLMTLIDFNTF
jgi:hypothetical protein